MKGEKIVAIKTDKSWGYVKGDELEIIDYGTGYLVGARNLTRPYIRDLSILREDEYRFKSEVKDVHIVRFLGIPLLKISKEVE